MWWKRLVTVAVGAALVAVGATIPGAGAVLIPAGVGVIGLALPFPGEGKDRAER